MNLPTLTDRAMFGVLISAWLFIAGALCRTKVKTFRRAGSTDPTLGTAFAVGAAVMLAGAASGAAFWAWLPQHGLGIWGALEVTGVVVSFGAAMLH